jgi:hypothetical protein
MSEEKKRKNNLYTLGYFTKRLRDCNFITLKIFNDYKEGDIRKWTILVDPGDTSVFITCLYKNETKEFMFHIDDGGKLFPKNFYMKTNSIEIIVEKLITQGVSQALDGSGYKKESA